MKETHILTILRNAKHVQQIGNQELFVPRLQG